MPELASCYTFSPSNDSTIAIEITTTWLRRRKKRILFFDDFNGEMRFSEKDPKAFKLWLAIKANSVECRDAKVGGKKRHAAADFARRDALAAQAYPEIRFDAYSISAKALRGFVVEGGLRIQDAVRTVKVNVVLSPMRKDALQLDGDAILRLSDFGLPTLPSLFGLNKTKDEAAIRLLLWAIPKVEPAAAQSHFQTGIGT